MADFTTGILKVTDVDDSIVLLFSNSILYASTPELVVDQLADVREEINAKTIQFSRYANLAAATTPLTDGVDPDSTALVDTAYTLTPLEYGAVVTTTKLANFQTGGKADMAAAFLVGRNMGLTQDSLGMAVLEAFSTTRIYPNAATSAGTLSTSDNLDLVFANRLYNKLARTNTPGIGGTYFGVAHDDCLHDLRNDLISVNQYSNLTAVLNNEIGMAGGIRWLRSSNVTVTADSNGTIDSYKVNVLGFNSFGKAVSWAPHGVISGPFDKLQRFVNVGWTGTFVYKLLDTANMVQGIVASSVGANAT